MRSTASIRCFGGLAITKSITLDCSGTFGPILVAGTNAINIPTAGIKVILRGLSFNGAGGTGIHAVNLTAAAQLTIERCQIFGFVNNGLNAVLTTGLANISIVDTYITQVDKAVFISATAPVTVVASLDNVLAFGYATSGLEAASANTIAFVSKSLFNGSTTGSAIITSAGAGVIDVSDSVITGNVNAINAAASGSVIRITRNALFANNNSIVIGAGATVATGGDNKVDPAATAPNATITTQ